MPRIFHHDVSTKQWQLGGGRRGYLLPQNFLTGSVKITQVTRVMAGGPEPWISWPAMPLAPKCLKFYACWRESVRWSLNAWDLTGRLYVRHCQRSTPRRRATGKRQLGRWTRPPTSRRRHRRGSACEWSGSASPPWTTAPRQTWQRSRTAHEPTRCRLTTLPQSLSLTGS